MNWKIGYIVALWFLVGCAVYAIISAAIQIPLFRGQWCLNNWSIVAAIGTWLLAGGVVFAFMQVQQMRKGTNAQIAIGLFQELQKQDRVETLRYIYSFDNPITHQDVERVLTEQHRNQIDMVLNQLDTLGVLVRNGVMDERLAIDGYAGATVLRCWYQLHRYIRGEQGGKRGSNVWEHLEDLANRTLEYAEKQRKPSYWIAFRPGHKDTRIDLVAELAKTEDQALRPKRLSGWGWWTT
jgi:hypothetical protein